MNKEEEEQRKTFKYQVETLLNACQKLKEAVIKEYGKPFFLVSDFKKMAEKIKKSGG